MIENRSKSALQIIVSSVFVFFSIFEIVAVILAYFEQKAQIVNPLIPEGLLLGIRNFTIFVVIAYLVIVLANLFSIYKKQYFYAVQIIAFMIMLSFQFFYAEIIDFFLNNA